jgi:hypothetical protein
MILIYLFYIVILKKNRENLTSVLHKRQNNDDEVQQCNELYVNIFLFYFSFYKHFQNKKYSHLLSY